MLACTYVRACVGRLVHGDIHTGQFLLMEAGGVRSYEEMVLCDFGNSVLLCEPTDFVHGMLATSTPDPLALASFVQGRPTRAHSGLDVVHERKLDRFKTYKESRLRSTVDDWWSLYLTLHRIADAPEEKDGDKLEPLPWDRFQKDELKAHSFKSECLFGPACKTRRAVEASLQGATAWRARESLPLVFRDALERVFKILVTAELSKDGFTDASVDAICAVIAQIQL